MGKGDLAQIGVWAFILGLIVAIVAGFMYPSNPQVALVLGILGLLVGLLNITDKEVMLFLIAAIAFLSAAGSLNSVLVPFVPQVAGMIAYIAVFVGPGAGIVAIKALYDVSRA